MGSEEPQDSFPNLHSALMGLQSALKLQVGLYLFERTPSCGCFKGTIQGKPHFSLAGGVPRSSTAPSKLSSCKNSLDHSSEPAANRGTKPLR